MGQVSNLRSDSMHILFDFDGTLVDHDKESIYRELLKELGLNDPTFGAQLAREEKALTQRGEYDRTLIFKVHEHRFPHHEPADLLRRYWQVFTRVQTVKPDCDWLLTTLRNEGYRLVCVTDSDGPGSDKLGRITASGLRPYFLTPGQSPDQPDIYIGSEAPIFERKGTEEFLRKILHHVGASADNSIMIGDKVDIDLGPAARLGIPCILVQSSIYGGEWPHSVTHLNEIPALIRRIAKQAVLS